MTALHDRYRAALTLAASTCETLVAEGRHDRAAGLAVAVDLGTSAAFLFSTGPDAVQDAIDVVTTAIDHAIRQED